MTTLGADREQRGMGVLAGLVPAAELPLLPAFLDHLRNGPRHHTSDTARTYKAALATFFRLVPGAAGLPLFESVTKRTLMMALAEIPYERDSARRNLFFAVKALASFLADMGVIEEAAADLIAAMRLRRGAKPARAHLTREQVEDVLRRVHHHGGYDDVERLTNLALFATLAFTGLRNTEACLLKLADVDFERGLIQVVRGKGDKARTLGLPTRLAPLLKAYLKHRPPTAAAAFFVGSTGAPLTRDLVIRRMLRITKITGVKVTAHALRRTFATEVAHRKGVPLDKLQQILGHADIITTRNYVQTSSSAVALEMRDW